MGLRAQVSAGQERLGLVICRCPRRKDVVISGLQTQWLGPLFMVEYSGEPQGALFYVGYVC